MNWNNLVGKFNAGLDIAAEYGDKAMKAGAKLKVSISYWT